MTASKIDAIYPTTPAQQGLIVGSLSRPDSSLFIEQLTLPLQGALDPDRFQQAWSEIVRRHEILRTALVWDLGEGPRQVVLSESEVETCVEVVDARGRNASEQDAAVEEILRRHRSEGFEIQHPPLVRLALQQRDAQTQVLIWTHHHAILDGWSQVRLIGELIESYAEPRADFSVPPTFGQFALWSSRRSLLDHVEYWRSAFSGFAPSAPPPPREVRGDHESFGTHEFTLSESDRARLDAYLRKNDLTLSALLLSISAVIASRLRGADDVVVGVTTSGRSSGFPESDRIIGPLSTTIPVRTQIDTRANLCSWARDGQERLADALPFSDCSSGQIHAWTELPADRALFDIVLAVANYPSFHPDPETRQRLQLRPGALAGHGGRTLHPLAVVVTTGDELGVRVVNDRSRVTDADAMEVVGAFIASLHLFDADSLAGVTDLIERTSGVPTLASAGHERASALSAPDSLEAVVSTAFASVLRLDRVSRNANFIEMGGHSLLALELLASLRKAFGVDLTLQDLFVAPTPSSVSDKIERLIGAGSASVPLPQIDATHPADREPFALSEIQEAYWVGRQPGFELSGVDSHIYAEVDVQGLDLERLQSAWRLAVDRHPMLRAVFDSDGRQRILEDVEDYTIRRVDGEGDALSRVRERLSHRKRDISVWPLFDIEAAVMQNGVTRLFLSFDLLIGDARSWHILYREVLRSYRDPNSVFEPLEITYRDYISALPAVRETQAYRDAREYWHARIDDLPLPPELPLLRQSRAGGSVRFHRQQLKLSPDETRALRAQAAAWGVTPSALMLGVFSEVLAIFTNTSEFLINLTLFSRLPLHRQVDSLVGDFTSLTLLSISIEEDRALRDRIRDLQRQLWRDIDNRLYSGLEVLRDLSQRAGRPTMARAPVVFTSTLDFAPAAPPDEEPLLATVGYAIGQTPQVTLDYQTYETDGEIVINWDSVEGLFPPGFLDDMFETHTRALRAVIRGEQDLVLPQPRLEPHASLLGAPDLLHDPFMRSARRSPDHIAVVSDGRQLSYRELFNLAVVAARILVENSSSDGDRVGILMEKGWEQVVGAVAVLMAGRTFVPIEPSWPSSRIESVLERTGIEIVLTQTRVMQESVVQGVAHSIAVDTLECPERGFLSPPPNSTTADQLAYVIFTSGSTGLPKGVMIQHRAALNTILDVNERFGVGPDDKVLALSPLAFDLAIYDVFGLLAAGGTIVIPKEGERRDPTSWARMMAEEGVSVWNSVPVLMDLLTGSSCAPAALESIRLCLMSGDWIPLELPPTVAKYAPDARIVSLGGATECSIWSILYEIGAVDESWSSIPYGYSMAGQTVEVLRSDHSPCPDWVPGEIFIGGHGLALGYWGDPKLTDESFVVDRRTGGRLYRTGDWGRRLPSGAIEFLGRRDQQVKIDGHRIELREVEAALAACSRVDWAAVVPFGERLSRRLVGFYQGGISPEALREELRSRLPEAMIPGSLRALESPPLSATGKVDRKQLVSLIETASEPAPSPLGPFDVDAGLRECVSATSGLNPGVGESLIALGLSSVDVIRLMNAIQDRYGSRPDIEGFYADPTLRGLARSIDSARGNDTDGVRSERHDDSDVWSRWELLADPAERGALRNPAPLLRVPPAERGRLNGEPIDADRYRRRVSTRGFSRDPVSREQMSRTLACLRRVSVDGAPRLLYPSAGGLYSVDVYVQVRAERVADTSAGLYYYNADEHDLVAVLRDVDFSQELFLGNVNAEAASSAAFVIYLVTDPARSAPLYGAAAERLNLLNAGYMGQLVCESAIETGLGICPIHGFDFDAVRWTFPHGERLVLLHLLVGGRAARP